MLMSGLERGRVVDAVAGHRDDLAERLERMHEAQLLLRCDSREHVDVLDAPRQLGIVEQLEISAGQHVVRGAQPDLATDVARGARVIAGHHHDAHAGRVALGDRPRDRRTDRVREPDEADQLEREVVLLLRQRARLERRLGHAEDPQSGACHRLDARADLAGLLRRQVAEVDDRLVRALRRDHVIRAVR